MTNYHSKEEALKQVRKNRLNDLCLMGINFIKDTADIIDLGTYGYTDDEGEPAIAIRLYGVLAKKEKTDFIQKIGYYIVWLQDDDEPKTMKWASFGWVREDLIGVEQLSGAIMKLNLSKHEDYRNI